MSDDVPSPVAIAAPAPPSVADVLSVLRVLAGASSWLSPGGSWRMFGLGSMRGDPSAALITRLFGVRDIALGLSIRYPSADVRRAALMAGVAINSIDAVAGLLALRNGAPKATGPLVAGGAAFFAVLGVIALQQEEEPAT